MKKIIPLLLLLVLVASCRTSSLGDKYRPDEPLSVSAKLSATLTIRDRDQSIGGTLRMRRDEAIQISLSKFGIEGVRLVFTPDYVLLLDRINKRAVQTTYEALSKNFPQTRALSFGDFQRFFWNEDERQRQAIETSIGNLLPLEIDIERRDHKSIRGYKIPQETLFNLEGLGGQHQLRWTLSNLKINYNWRSTTEAPEGYKPYATSDLLRMVPKLLK